MESFEHMTGLGDGKVTIDKDGTLRVYGTGGEDESSKQHSDNEFKKVMSRGFAADMWAYGKLPLVMALLCLLVAGLNFKNGQALAAWILCASLWIVNAMMEVRLGIMKVVSAQLLKDNAMMGMYILRMRAAIESARGGKNNAN